MVVDYTLVVGVDEKHLRQLSWTWPTWKKHKPSLLGHPMIVFYDRDQVSADRVLDVVDHPDLRILPWPPRGVFYGGSGKDKWTDPQRHKMLAGFVHIPAHYCQTPYWLKLDTDVVATGYDDWINPEWFVDDPAIVAHKWGFTKPADQIDVLDRWSRSVEWGDLKEFPPLGISPTNGSDRVNHPRIISWCGFFGTDMTAVAALAANNSCGEHKLPVPSQDGYLWYLSALTGKPIVRTNMKKGWEHWSTDFNVRAASERAMAC